MCRMRAGVLGRPGQRVRGSSRSARRPCSGWPRRPAARTSSCPGGSVIALRSTASLPSLGELTTPQPALPSGWLPTHTIATSRSARELDGGVAHVADPAHAELPARRRPSGHALDPFARRDRVGRRAGVPVEQHLVRERARPRRWTPPCARSSGSSPRRVLRAARSTSASPRARARASAAGPGLGVAVARRSPA